MPLNTAQELANYIVDYAYNPADQYQEDTHIMYRHVDELSNEVTYRPMYKGDVYQDIVKDSDNIYVYDKETLKTLITELTEELPDAKEGLDKLYQEYIDSEQNYLILHGPTDKTYFAR